MVSVVRQDLKSQLTSWSVGHACMHDAGLKRSGKSCRLRWVNYLRPDLKRGKITPQEESVILQLHALWGNR
jgi:hypothetical protein